jgi:hypothetical protein
LKSGQVENRSQKEVAVEPELLPKSVEMKVKSPPLRPAEEIRLDSGADKEAMAEGEATATKDVPKTEQKTHF